MPNVRLKCQVNEISSVPRILLSYAKWNLNADTGLNLSSIRLGSWLSAESRIINALFIPKRIGL